MYQNETVFCIIACYIDCLLLQHCLLSLLVISDCNFFLKIKIYLSRKNHFFSLKQLQGIEILINKFNLVDLVLFLLNYVLSDLKREC